MNFDSKALTEWITGAGGHVGPVEIRSSGSGRGVFSTAPVADGQLILRVPRVCCVTPETETPVGRAIEAAGNHPLIQDAVFAARLLDLRRSDDARFRPLLAGLPDALPDFPLFYATQRARALVGSSLPAQRSSRVDRLTIESDWLRGNVAELAGLDGAEWALVRALVGSRTFHLSDEAGPAMVPYADLLNAAIEPDVAWEFDAALDALVVKAVRPIAEGAEVLTSYGPKSNLRFLMHFGFTFQDNPHDECLVTAGGETLHLGRIADASYLDPRTLQAMLRDPRAAKQACEARLQGLDRVPLDPNDPSLLDVRRLRAGKRAILESWLGNL